MGDIALSPREFMGFEPNAPAKISLSLSESSTPYSIDTYSTSEEVISGEYILAPLYKTERNEPAVIKTNGNTLEVIL